MSDAKILSEKIVELKQYIIKLELKLARRDELLASSRERELGTQEQVTMLKTLYGECKDAIARRDEQIAELEAMIDHASFTKYLVNRLKDPELAARYADAVATDDSLKILCDMQKKDIARRDDLIKRLVDMCKTFAHYGEVAWKPMADNEPRFMETLRALMKELDA